MKTTLTIICWPVFVCYFIGAFIALGAHFREAGKYHLFKALSDQIISRGTKIFWRRMFYAFIAGAVLVGIYFP